MTAICTRAVTKLLTKLRTEEQINGVFENYSHYQLDHIIYYKAIKKQ